VKVGCIAQGIWQQSRVDCLRPAGVRMEQLLPCSFREVSDGSVGDTILEVGIYPTEGVLLPCFMACLLKGVVVKVSIVAIIV
jgi:hypothetical protein